jgi:hypothetical protein
LTPLPRGVLFLFRHVCTEHLARGFWQADPGALLVGS